MLSLIHQRCQRLEEEKEGEGRKKGGDGERGIKSALEASRALPYIPPHFLAPHSFDLIHHFIAPSSSSPFCCFMCSRASACVCV